MVASRTPSILAQVLLKAGNAAPQRIALRFLDAKGEEKALTFAALNRRMCSIAEFLFWEVDAGAAVLLALSPGLDFLPAFLGCLHARVLAVPVAEPIRASDRDRIEKIAANCNAVIGLTVRELRAKLSGPGGEAGDAANRSATLEWVSVEDIVDGDFSSVRLAERRSSSPASRSRPDE
jgi:acyl-CoA synthetase (AMP-forming)/AMP-acid ligase II